MGSGGGGREGIFEFSPVTTGQPPGFQPHSTPCTGLSTQTLAVYRKPPRRGRIHILIVTPGQGHPSESPTWEDSITHPAERKNSHAVVHSASISADTLPETQQFPDLLHPPGSWSANRAEESGEGGCSGILFASQKDTRTVVPRSRITSDIEAREPGILGGRQRRQSPGDTQIVTAQSLGYCEDSYYTT